MKKCSFILLKKEENDMYMINEFTHTFITKNELIKILENEKLPDGGECYFDSDDNLVVEYNWLDIT